MGQLSEQITLSYFVTNNAQKGQMGFLPDQRLLVIKEFSRGTDDINYCCEHNILVTNYKQSRKMISGGWVLCPTSVSQSSCRAPSSLLPSLTQHLNSQLCYFCQVWSDCLCLLRSCLLQSLSRPSRWPGLQEDSSDNRSRWKHWPFIPCPSTMLLTNVPLLRGLLRLFFLLRSSSVISKPTVELNEGPPERTARRSVRPPPHRTALRSSNSGLLLLNSQIHKFILGELFGGFGFLCFLFCVFYYTIYLF